MFKTIYTTAKPVLPKNIKRLMPPANEENVVNPPQKPVVKNFPQLFETVFLVTRAVTIPMMKHPTRLTIKIANWSEYLNETKNSARYLKPPPKKHPKQTINNSILLSIKITLLNHKIKPDPQADTKDAGNNAQDPIADSLVLL